MPRKTVLVVPVRLPYSLGSPKAFNMSLLLKWRWRLFQNPNALWIHVVKAIHGDEADNNKDCLIQHRIANASWAWDRSRPVNAGRTKAEFDALILDIASIEPDDLGVSDSCIWSLSHDNSFSVNSVRKHIDELTLPTLSPCTRWCKAIPRNVNIFMWRMFLNRLPIRFIFRRAFRVPVLVLLSHPFPLVANGILGFSHGTLPRKRRFALTSSLQLLVGPFGIIEIVSHSTLFP
ncbi:hypothetical protein Tco_1395269 [Tanacetum coccineum]